MSRFAVTATCGEAYEGVAQVSMCQEPGEPFRGGEHATVLPGEMMKKFDSYFLKPQTGGVFFYFEILVRFLRSPYFQKKSEPLVQGWPSIFHSFCAVHNSL